MWWEEEMTVTLSKSVHPTGLEYKTNCVRGEASVICRNVCLQPSLQPPLAFGMEPSARGQADLIRLGSATY